MIDPYAPPRAPKKKRTRAASSPFISPAALAQGLIVATIAVSMVRVLIPSIPVQLGMGVRVTAIITLFVWVYEASSTVRYRPGITMSPSTTIVWFFVPFANLWIPFRALGEIDRASDPELEGPARPWITMWQVLSVITITARVTAKVTESTWAMIADGLAELALCATVIVTIRTMEPNLARLRKKRRRSKD